MSESPASTGLHVERGDAAAPAAAQRLDRTASRAAAPHDAVHDGGSHALALECAGIGAALGGTVGVVVATLASMASVSWPALGLVMAGPLAAALMGAAVGALAGAVLGAWLDAHAAHMRAQTTDPRSDAGTVDHAEALWQAGAADRIDTATR